VVVQVEVSWFEHGLVDQEAKKNFWSFPKKHRQKFKEK
jgi:hypothetical protein